MKDKGLLFYSVLFVLLVLAQGLVFDQIEPGWGIHIMIYPMFIFLLPFNMRPTNVLFIAFCVGMMVDLFTNSFGLHTSSLVFLAYFRPQLYKLLEPREGYELGQIATIGEMKRSWFMRAYGVGILVHHLVFFTLEIFKITDIIFILQKTFLSSIFSFVMILLIQLIFFNRAKKV